MTTPERTVMARLSTDLQALSEQLVRVSANLTELNQTLTAADTAPEKPPAPAPVDPRLSMIPPRPPAPKPPVGLNPGLPRNLTQAASRGDRRLGARPGQAPASPIRPGQQPGAVAPRPPVPVAPRPPVPVAPRPPIAPRPPRKLMAPGERDGWISKALAVAGVAVTLGGIVMLLVLAAQAGILRPEIRVAAGVVLAAALVAVAHRIHSRPGGRIGGIALAATGVATGYMTVIAATIIYHWIAASVGLILAAVVGGGGLMLARRWDAQALGLLVFVPLIALAPFLTGGMNLSLVAFMLALAAASLPVQIGKDWIGLFAARIAAPTVPLLFALVDVGVGHSEQDWLLGAAAAAASVLALGSAIVVLRTTVDKPVLALLTAGGLVPLLAAGLVVDRIVAGAANAALAAALLGVVWLGDRIPGMTTVVRHIWASVAAVAALLAVAVAANGPVFAPLLLALAVVVAVAGREYAIARWAASVYGVVAGVYFLLFAPPIALVIPTEVDIPTGMSTLVSCVLVVAFAAAVVWSWGRRVITDARLVAYLWTGAAIISVYAVTMFTVTAGVLMGGVDGGFFGGHVAATICWIAIAAALLSYAARQNPGSDRSLPIGGGLTLTGAAVAKLIGFDLGTLDGIFRVIAFIVVGLVLLGMGTSYARMLAGQDAKS